MTLFRPTMIALLLVVSGLVNMAQSADFAQARSTMDRYLAAQSRWQDNLAAALIKDMPEFTVIAKAQRDHQHALIALKRARFTYLVSQHPDRLDTGELGRFTNFSWTEADTAAARVNVAGYSSLEQQVNLTRAVNDGQPNWDAFRDYFRNKFSSSNEFKKELARFQAELEDIKRDGAMKE